MSRLANLLTVSSLILGTLVVAACGSSDSSDLGGGGAGGTGGAGGFGDGTGAGGTANGGDNSGAAGNVGNVDPSSACATSSAGAAMPPISLVFMIDRSGSMEEEDNVSTIDVRWNPVKNGLTSFFGDPKSKNISASLAFFPIVSGSGQNQTTSCTSADYKKAVVGMTDLPNAAAFSGAFTKGPDGRTPTEPALKGALDAARDVKAQGKNVAVVLATDGAPNGCSSDPSGVEQIAAAGLADGIKTYVVGVGPNTGNLNGFASKGGTGNAIMIPTNDAAQVSADLIAAIGSIASSLLGCSYSLPAPPAGQTLNVNAVNVNYTPPGGTASTLPYSADCAKPNGWHYDSTQAPSEVVLCSEACTTAKSAVGAKLDIIFGCATAVPPGGVDPNGNVK